MAQITLLRHGQASFGSDNYDRLSATGHLQALWLGQQLQHLGESFDRIVTGTMVRHDETAQGVISGLGLEPGVKPIAIETHTGLNEYDFEGLLKPLKQQYPEQWVETGHARRDYYHNMKAALTHWMNATIATDGRDSWQSFCRRVRAGFDFAYGASVKRTLVVSSGGPISVILAEVLGLDPQRTCDLTLQIKNSSTSKLLYRRPTVSLDDFTLDSFNDVSHLLSRDKQDSITFS